MPVLNYCFLTFFMLIIGLNLSSCSRPDATPPSVEPALLSYLNTLEKGDLKALDQLYFMPLHWRHQQKIYKQFNQQHELLKQKTLILKMMSFKQKGRWALSAIAHNQSGKIQIKPVWFFYYENRWQFVSPIIFKTGPVRSMMNLHREQNDLRAWYANEQENRRKPAK